MKFNSMRAKLDPMWKSLNIPTSPDTESRAEETSGYGENPVTSEDNQNE